MTARKAAPRPNARGRSAPARLAALVLAPFLLSFVLHAAHAREIVDSAGRKVAVPDRITRVVAAGPPASALMYVLAPEKLVGWVLKPRPAELPYLLSSARELPEVGRLTGRGGTANLEAIIAAKPDLIVDFGSINATFISLADRVQSQTGIPYLLIDGRFANTAAAVRLFGSILGVEARASMIAGRTEQVLGAVEKAVQAVPQSARPRVYLARRADGLESGNRGSINTEIIERAGATNVVDSGRPGGGLVTVSIEQILEWNPDTIITTDRNFVTHAKTEAAWLEVGAVKRGRVFLSPSLPYGWIDAPPSINRVLGLEWLAALFYPDRFHIDVRTETRSFYKLFYQVDLTNDQLDRLLEGAK